ncbi:MAG: ABC transporter permease, partial [Desulfarculaceae bacterium]
AVYDQDRSVTSRRLLAGFEASEAFGKKYTVHSEREIQQLIDDRQALMALRVHPRFQADLLAGRSGKVQVIVDGRNSNTALVMRGYVLSIGNKFATAWSQEHGLKAPPARLNVRTWYNPNLESQWFIVPGIVGLLTLVVTLIVTALSVAREREDGTFDQLLVTPLRPVEILMGKALPGMLIGLVEGSFIILVAVLWFEIPLRGSLAALYLGLFLFLLSAIGLGLMISAFSATQQQGLLGAFLLLVPSVVLSGFATPIANMPEIVQKFTLINPLRYFLVVLRGVFLRDAPWELLWMQYWPMALIGLSSLVLAGALFRRRIY